MTVGKRDGLPAIAYGIRRWQAGLPVEATQSALQAGLPADATRPALQAGDVGEISIAISRYDRKVAMTLMMRIF